MKDKKEQKIDRLNRNIKEKLTKDEMSKQCDIKALEKFKEKPFYLKIDI
ncbi:hypothetical protein [Anaerosacchariphilus polymeriproducens]|nr:hypothetical protein [Anaerosacchariphilus polymeriproducens]